MPTLKTAQAPTFVPYYPESVQFSASKKKADALYMDGVMSVRHICRFFTLYHRLKIWVMRQIYEKMRTPSEASAFLSED